MKYYRLARKCNDRFGSQTICAGDPPLSTADAWSTEDVLLWLEGMGLSQHAAAFKRNGVSCS